MSLADYYDGVYLDAGWHKVRITDLELFNYNSGSDGVKFHLETSQGTKGKISFVLKYDSPGCMARLASFAKACGLTKEDCARYEPERASSHSALLRKSVQVESALDKEGKWHEIVGWRSINAPELPNTAPVMAHDVPSSAPTVAPATPTETYMPSGDDIPF